MIRITHTRLVSEPRPDPRGVTATAASNPPSTRSHHLQLRAKPAAPVQTLGRVLFNGRPRNLGMLPRRTSFFTDTTSPREAAMGRRARELG